MPGTIQNPHFQPLCSKRSRAISLVALTETRGALLHFQTQFPAGKTPRAHLHSHKLGCSLHFAAAEGDNWEGLASTFLSKMPLMTPEWSPSTARSTEQPKEWELLCSNHSQPSRTGNIPRAERQAQLPSQGRGGFMDLPKSQLFKNNLQRQQDQASKSHPFRALPWINSLRQAGF